MRYIHVFLITCMMAFFPNSGMAQLKDKVALVIGNSKYENATKLKNPYNDAIAISKSFAELGFDVEKAIDLKKADLEISIRNFGKRARGAKVSVFFYAGHAFQVDGTNYIIPVDAKIFSEQDISFETIDMRSIIKQIDTGERVNLIFLDSCRDNPFARSLGFANGRSMANPALAPMEAPTGTLISYSTQDGYTAADGVGNNSPYTAALLKHLKTPGIDVGIMLRSVRNDVLESTKKKQRPWEYGSLIGEFQLNPGERFPAAPRPTPSQPASTFPTASPVPVAIAAPLQPPAPTTFPGSVQQAGFSCPVPGTVFDLDAGYSLKFIGQEGLSCILINGRGEKIRRYANFLIGGSVEEKYHSAEVASLWPLEIGKKTQYRSCVPHACFENYWEIVRTEIININNEAVLTFVVSVREKGDNGNDGIYWYWYSPKYGYNVKRRYDHISGKPVTENLNWTVQAIHY